MTNPQDSETSAEKCRCEDLEHLAISGVCSFCSGKPFDGWKEKETSAEQRAKEAVDNLHARVGPGFTARDGEELWLAGHRDGRDERDILHEQIDHQTRVIKALEAENEKLKHFAEMHARNVLNRDWDKLEQEKRELIVRATTFLARAREGCEELNPNNYNEESALWKAEVALGRFLNTLAKAGK